MRKWISAAVALLCGLGVSTVANASARSGDYSVQLLSETGRVLPTFQQDGRSYAMGVLGHRYSLRVRNGSDRRVEFVASVDGRDVLDGNPSSWNKRGYLVSAHSEVVIDGFRLSREAVAAFRFSSVHSSYASRMGDARDVGVIGVAVFPEGSQPPVAQPDHSHFWNSVWGSAAQGESTGAVDDKSAEASAAPGEAPPAAPQPAPLPAEEKSVPPETQATADLAPAPASPMPAAMGAPPPPPSPVAHARASAMTFKAAGLMGKTVSMGAGAGGFGAMGRGASAQMAGAPAPAKMARKVERPGLGTEFGERRYSQADEVQFERASSRPAVVLSLHYDNREGLIAMGIDVDRRLELAREARLRHGADPFRRNAPLYDRSPALLAR